MRYLAGLLLLVCLPASADVYNLSITMASVSGATTCKPYLNGTTALAAKPCGSAQAYPGAIPVEGAYNFSYSGVSALGTEGDKSPLGITIVIDKKPGTPPTGPTYSVSCRDAAGASIACPPNISITQAP